MNETNSPSIQPEMYCGVTLKPDKEEKKQIRRQYMKVGLVILCNVVLFNIVLVGILYIAGGFYSGDFSSFYALKKGTSLIASEHPALWMVISCVVPIISETVSIILGIKLTKLDLKSLITRNGFTGKETATTVVVSLGIQTFAAVLVAIITAILNIFDLSSPTADLTADTNSLAATLFTYFYACLLGPVLEEVLYRGVILQGMKKYNELFAVAVSAIIFGLMHQNYQQFILAVMLGAVLGRITIKSGSLIPAIITHIFVNTTGVLSGLIMQCADNEAYKKIASGAIDNAALTGLSPQFMVVVIINALVRYGLMFAAIILLIISIVKKDRMSRPTPAGKSRGWPILAQSPIWYVILVAYIFLTFIQPFMK